MMTGARRVGSLLYLAGDPSWVTPPVFQGFTKHREATVILGDAVHVDPLI